MMTHVYHIVHYDNNSCYMMEWGHGLVCACNHCTNKACFTWTSIFIENVHVHVSCLLRIEWQ